MKLTIGMATYDDFDGCFFTVQALRMYQDMQDVEILVIDNFGCDWTKNFIDHHCTNARYIRYAGVVGTSLPRDLVFREAHGDAVLCLDCHVMLVPGAIARLKKYYNDNPNTNDLIQGPLLHDDLITISTHFNPVWNDHMYGTWGLDPRGYDPGETPFDIPMQGLGLFSCRRSAWLGFNQSFKGFGGEEGYIHEKFRQAGNRCLCLPWLKWMHRFGRPYGTGFPLNIIDRINNYLIGHDELNLDINAVIDHFAQYTDRSRIIEAAKTVLAHRQDLDTYK